MHRFVRVDGDGDRDGIGGRPYLRDGIWPVCTHDKVVTAEGPARCERYGKPMTHFLRFDTRAEHGLKVPVGSHFSLFLCPACADAVIPNGKPPARMPERFWEGGARVASLEAGLNYTNHGWWYASLEAPGAPLVRAPEPDPDLQPAGIRFEETDEPGFHVGGEPDWMPGPEGYICACGEPMVFLFQIPENHRFPVFPDAPPQRGVTWSNGKPWAVFLGNQAYFFACPKGCDPRAVMPVNQS